MSLFGIPDINVNSRVLDQVQIFKRIYDQARSTAKDLSALKPKYTTQPFAREVNPDQNSFDRIDGFVTHVARYGLARPNRFKVYVFPASVNSVDNQMVSMLCESASFPSNNIMTHDFRTYGIPVQRPYGKIHDPVNLTFLNDTNFSSKRFFDNWIDSIYDRVTGDINFYDSYTGMVMLQQLSQDDQTVYSVILTNAYPKLVSEIQLNQSSQGDYERVQVQFVYEKIHVTAVNLQWPHGDQDEVRKKMNTASGLDKQRTLDKFSKLKNSAISGFEPGVQGIVKSITSKFDVPVVKNVANADFSRVFNMFS